MFDIIIRKGTIIDGTGEEMFKGDVGIEGDKIIEIGDLSDEKGEKEIDANGLLVCPGFVDVDNHSDTFWKMFSNPKLESLVYQGITTIVGGNCGSSLAPLVSLESLESIQKWTDYKKINIDWITQKEFFDFLEKKNLALNFATLVGHGTLRRGILKDDVRNLKPKEFNFIQKILANSLRSGALGLSTGLVYTHARTTMPEELLALAKTVKKFDGVYTTHMKNEMSGLIDSLESVIDLTQKTKVKTHISHLKAVGKNNWSKMEEAFLILENAFQNKLDISFDVYPYTNTGSVLYSFLPGWVSEGGKRMMLHRLKNMSIRKKVVAEMKKSEVEYGEMEIASSPIDKNLTKRKISEIASSLGKKEEEIILDILLASEGRVTISWESLKAENVRKAILHPLSFISTNGAGYDNLHFKTGEMIHPRSFGTFIKVLEEYVLKNGDLNWEEAIAKMSYRPAKKFGLKKRGCLKKDFFADILVLDENKISSLASRENPYQYAGGVEYSIINGKIILEEGEYKNFEAGRVIKK
ncbi:MAG: hypothetical protein COZ85_00015 [Candidatus Moranbacteria bacterium CG_4_8_14_3_um_filter_34_16]|nr:MAG: hypothetical protein COT31_01540 [Candidatus Moranbacteria bacterium CG08_land_8_20_14_0_20_34_16]PIW95410.1 MAG: hypothetical protein COZ85_00015 [Candidatus Moranbacteria bacterium CG_4_8_14_3_um_filter_34_16]